MCVSIRKLCVCSVLGALMLVMSVPSTRAQGEPPSTLTVVVGSGASREAIDEVDRRIARMLAAGELVRVSNTVDALDAARRHEFFAQRHRGVPVFGGGVGRQTVGDTTVSAFGTLYLGIDLETRAVVALDSAVATMRQASVAALTPGGDVSLVVMPELDGRYRLVYRATLLDGSVRTVDAESGVVIRTEDARTYQRTAGVGTGTHGDQKKVSSSRVGDTYEAVDALRPASIVTRSTLGTNVTSEALFAGAGTTAVDADNVWTTPAVVDAHVHAGWTYDYFNQRMGWSGLDGQNATINQVSTGLGLLSGFVSDGVGPASARFGTQDLACNRSGFVLTDGTFLPFFCVNGQYALALNPSGAANEGFSDIFGTAVEARYHPLGNGALRADYLSAEDARTGGNRSLSDPGSFAAEQTGVVRYPDHADRRIRYVIYVQGGLLNLAPYTIVNGQMINVSLDNGAVHFNATIWGHAYYLAVEGGINRTSGRSVTGVGFANRELVERVYFRAMTQLMPPIVTSFSTVAAVIRQAAVDLYGTSSAAYRAVDESLVAAGL